jgi:sRNA-binding carbon storage regulator CsrA
MSDSTQPIGHLAVTRHRGESVMIGDTITVEVAEIIVDGRPAPASARVKLRIAAPRDVEVDRSELRSRKRGNGGAS